MIRTSLNIATLNCRGLRKAHNPSSSNSFIRYLRSLNIDILCLQETHAADAQIMAQFDMLFNTHSSLWSPHCGIVSLHRNLTIRALPSLTHADGRFLCASVASDTDPSTPILHLLNIYAPAQSGPRQLFFQQLVDTPPLMSLLYRPELPTFILGDFNFNPSRRSNITDSWLELLDMHYTDCFEQEPTPTFTSASASRTRIDFIFCSALHSHTITSTDHTFISSVWTDHDLLSVTFRPALQTTGPGLWKADPFLAKIPSFREGLTSHIELFVASQNLLVDNCSSSTQDLWDSLKAEVKAYIRSYQFETNRWRSKTLKRYQSKRNRILRDYKNTVILSSLLPTGH
ncbi:Endonuclease/exonuclease/phosphatase [Blakeslea trispora]|nr:Endonuclease/exonuclease/phosphatase [Blakeslea trispora]